MATSGTVGLTQLDTATALEHAFRRVRIHPSKQTPEKVQLALNNLFLLLAGPMSTRGINLWTVTKTIQALTAGQATYQCPVGTIDILNLVYSQATTAAVTTVTGTNSMTATITAGATTIPRIGFELSTVTASDTATITASTDGGVTWATVGSVTRSDWVANTWYWYDLSVVGAYTNVRVTFGQTCTFSGIQLASVIYDLPVKQWNRDTWSVINNKTQSGRPSTQYYFERLMQPQFTLWPVPNNSTDQVTLFTTRQPQDVGTLLNTLEIPSRWYEPVIWQLALRLAFEIDEVPMEVIPIVQQMADRYQLEVEYEEADGAPLFITPNIRGYTA